MDCVFCKIVAGEIPAKKVFENDRVLAFHDITPAAEKHYLIIPKEHVSTALDLDESNAGLVSDLYLAAKEIAKGENVPGYKLQMNVGQEGGQVVMHVHLHFIAGEWLSDRRTV